MKLLILLLLFSYIGVYPSNIVPYEGYLPLPEKYVVTEETQKEYEQVENRSADIEAISSIIRNNQRHGISLSEPTINHMANSIIHHSLKYDVPVEEILAVIRIESVFDPNIVGTSQDRGLMQIIPSTEKFLAEDLKLTNYNIFDIDTNINMGVYYISRNKKQYGKWLGYIAYNQGLSETLNEATLNRHKSREDSYVSMVIRFSNEYREKLRSYR